MTKDDEIGLALCLPPVLLLVLLSVLMLIHRFRAAKRKQQERAMREQAALREKRQREEEKRKQQQEEEERKRMGIITLRLEPGFEAFTSIPLPQGRRYRITLEGTYEYYLYNGYGQRKMRMHATMPRTGITTGVTTAFFLTVNAQSPSRKIGTFTPIAFPTLPAVENFVS